MSEKTHLFDLRLRTSAAGNEYLSGWLGKAAVVGFRDREAEGEVWNIFVSTPAPRQTEAPNRQRKPRRPDWVDQADALDDRLDDL